MEQEEIVKKNPISPSGQHMQKKAESGVYREEEQAPTWSSLPLTKRLCAYVRRL